MKRNVDMSEISDGKLYGLNDMVKVDCQDCKGCSVCCHIMGDTIVLDPLDVHLLKTNLNVSFEELMQTSLELKVREGFILPSLKLDATKGCTFLNEEGRCTVHAFRPGLCRIFPLGRFYRHETRDFLYFLQTKECVYENRTKMKVSKWIGVPNLKQNQEFIAAWHYFLKDIRDTYMKTQEDYEANEGKIKKINLLILQEFYINDFDKEKSIYEQLTEKIASLTV